jgi:hypothetical protein
MIGPTRISLGSLCFVLMVMQLFGMVSSKLTTFDPDSIGIRLQPLEVPGDSLEEVLYLFKKHHLKKSMFRNAQWKEIEEKLRSLPTKEQVSF